MPRRHIVPDVVHNQSLVLLPPDSPVLLAARRMAERGVSAVLVTEGEALLGIFTERDMTARVVAEGRDPATTPLGHVMTANPHVLAPSALAGEALVMMQTNNYRHIPVVDGSRVIGIVSIRDLYAVVHEQLEEDLRDREDFIFGSGYSVNATVA